MAAPGMENWVYDKGEVKEKDIKALERAKRIEEKREKSGFAWVQVDPRVKAFVPCGRDGKPTEEGLRQIEILKKTL